MTFQVPNWEEEPKETMVKMVSFWAKPSIIDKLDLTCRLEKVERSEIMRILVKLFLFEEAFQRKVLELIRKNDI